MQLRYKVVLLAVVPLMLAAAVLALVARQQNRELAQIRTDGIDEALAWDELSNLMRLARQAVPELDHIDGRDPAASRRVLDALRALDFGKDGYFYVYDLNGNNLMHPRRPELEGTNQWELKDDRGELIIQQLIDTAKASGDGGGLRRYRWPRPSQQTPGAWADKIGYVVHLRNLGWMLGTGIYLDDIKGFHNATQKIQESSTAATTLTMRRTMRSIAAIAAIGVLLVGGLGILLNVSQRRLADAKLRKLTWAIMEIEEQERARMSRYLHDEAMQDLIAVGVVIDNAVIELERSPAHAQVVAKLGRGLAGLRHGVDQIRAVSHGLRPRLQHDGLAELLEQTGAAFFERSGVKATIDVPAVVPAMSADAVTALFRVTQQALDNVERHARATLVTVQLVASRRLGMTGVRLTVSDNGCGFPVAAVEARPVGGIGLLNMRERIEALGGRLLIRSGSNGTHLEAFLPNEASRKDDAHDGRYSEDA